MRLTVFQLKGSGKTKNCRHILYANLFLLVGILAINVCSFAQTNVPFSFTGSMQTWTVPSGVTSITVDAGGAQGGGDATNTTQALGGRVQATLTVSPGQVLNIFVGGAGGDGNLSSASAAPGGYNGGGSGGYYSTVPPGYTGGGGGGATDIRIGGTTLNDRVIVAGGGGGGGYTASPQAGGAGGNAVGGNGNTGSGITAATGGGSAAGGLGGTFGGQPNGGNGALGIGGNASTGNGIPGGGGGGYFGGGGGGTTGAGPGGGGGGGSSYFDSEIGTGTYTQGYNSGNGYLIISYVPANITPSFVNGATTSLSVCQNAAATDIKSLLHVSDADASQTLTWTQLTAPDQDGTLTITGAIATSGGTDVTPGGTITYIPANGFSGTESFKIRVTDGTASDTIIVVANVYAYPTINLSGSDTVCNGSSTTLTATGADSYVWTPAANLSATTGSTSVYSGTIAATYTVTGSNHGCVGTPYTFTTFIKPVPTLTSTLTPAAICDSVLFTYTPASSLPNTTFSWSRAFRGEDVINPAATGTDDPMEYLYNTSPLTAPGVEYVYTLTADGCSNTQTVKVDVYAKAVLTSTLTPSAICNNTVFHYTPASNEGSAAFAWSRAAVTGINNVAANGSDDPAETLVNTTTDPVVVTYIYTLTANGCSNTQQVNVTVKPTPVLSSTLTATPVCSNSPFDYLPTSATTGTSFTWSRALVTGISNTANSGTDDPEETLVNTTNAPITVTYVYTLTANSCSNTQDVTVVVNPKPSVNTLSNVTVCNGDTTATVILGSNVTGATYAWSNNNATIGLATSGTGNIASFTAVNNDPFPVVATVSVTASAEGCTGNATTLTIRVNPTPAMNPVSDVAVCNNASTNAIDFAGTAPGFASAAALPGYVWTNSNTGIGLANSGTGNISSFTAVNTTTDPVIAEVHVTPVQLGCYGLTDTFTITVNPTPVLTSTLTATPVCNNTVFNYTPTSATAGTAYSWSRATVTGITNAANAGSDDPNEVLINTTTDPVIVTYNYTLTANSCANSEDVSVTVYPTPVLSSTLTATPVCDSSLFSYTPTSATTGTTYSWSRAAVTGISNAANAGTDNPMEYLINTTPDPVNVVYVYTLTANGCSNTQTVVVTVYPKPLLSTTLTPAAICDNTVFAYTPSSLTTGTHYVWSRDVVAGISNAANADNTDPAETLNNTTTAPVAVTYVYTLSANGCTNTQNVVVVVNPTPVLTSTLTAAPVCDSTLFSYTPTSATAGTAFTWSRAAVTGISNVAASGSNDPSEYLVNTTSAPVVVTYIDTLIANGCMNTQAVTVTVNPKPLLSSTLTPVAICDSTLFTYVPTSTTAGTTFGWSRSVVAGIANTLANGNNDPLEYLDNTIADPATVLYLYTLTANGCSNTQTVAVVVNPTPKLSSSLTPAAVCNNTSFTYIPASATVGTSYVWTRAAVTGISNLAGAGADSVAEILANTTNHQVTTDYIFTLTANACQYVQTVTATVNPTPLLSGTTIATVCSGAPFNYTPGSATTGTTFAWTRATAPGISNTAGVSTGTAGVVNEVLNNMTLAPKTVIYHYTLSAFGCSNPQNVTVTVNPAPQVPVIAINTPSSVCSNTMFQNFGAATDAPDTVQYTWSAIGATVLAQGSGHRNSIVSFPDAGNANVILTANVPGIACYRNDTFAVTVTSSEATNPGVYYVHDHFVCVDNTVDSYQWGFDDVTTLDSTIYTGQVDQNFYQASPDFAHKLYWVMTSKGGCSSKSYYNAPTGVTQIGTATVAAINVFPNPASNNVAVDVTGLNDGRNTLELTDITGKVITTDVLNNGKTVLNVTDLSAGVYIVSCYHNGVKAGTTKLIKE